MSPGVVGERVPYREAGKAQRQAHQRAFACESLSLGALKVLDAVLDETTSFSRLNVHVATGTLARHAGVSVRTVRRALARLAAQGVLVHRAGLGRGNLSFVGVPPDGVKADAYLSALLGSDLSAFPGGEKGTSTRARGVREEHLRPNTAVGVGVDLGVDVPPRTDPVVLVHGDQGEELGGDGRDWGDERAAASPNGVTRDPFRQDGLSDDEILRLGTASLDELLLAFAEETA